MPTLLDSLYSNPETIQAKIIADMEARLTGGRVIADGNNVPVHIMESCSTTTSDAMVAMLAEIKALHPKRALTITDLYKHMSDNDYIGLFASPATMYIEIILNAKQLALNALDYNEFYKKAVIPRESIFTLDTFKFSLNYPVEIRINKQTSTFVVSYDNTVETGLEKLITSSIDHRTMIISGVEVLSIRLPIHQFVRAIAHEDITNGSPFVKSYPYTDKFYACSVFTDTGVNGSWKELHTALADVSYDPAVPTAKLVVDTDHNRVRVYIPQVYVNKNLLGSKIKVEVYTTRGAVSADMSALRDTEISAKFITEEDTALAPFTEVLMRPEMIIVNPLTKKLVGGSDGISFDALRERVVHNAFVGDTLITPIEMENFFKDLGFSVRKLMDGITNRIYMCSKIITDKNEAVVATATIPTILRLSSAQYSPTDKTDLRNYQYDNKRLVNYNGDGTFTILPGWTYKMDPQSKTAVPLTPAEIIAQNNWNNSSKVLGYNSGRFTVSPYHIHIDTNGRAPLANVYDFYSPTVSNVEFIKENVNVASQLSVFSATVMKDPLADSFILRLVVAKSSDLEAVPISAFKIVALTTADSGTTVYQLARYESSQPGYDTWVFTFDTDFQITKNDGISITSLRDASGATQFIVPILSKMSFIFFVDKAKVPSPATTVAGFISDEFRAYTPLAKYNFDLEFGRRMDSIYARVDLFFSDLQFATYPETIYAIHTSTVYERTNGNIVYNVDVGGHVNVSVLARPGDPLFVQREVSFTANNIDNYLPNGVHSTTILSTSTVITEGNKASYIGTTAEVLTSVLYEKGDRILDGSLNPVIDPKREVIFHVDMIHLDKKLIVSDKPEHANFVSQFTDTVSGYVDAVAAAEPRLLESTEIFFQPRKSIGYSKFRNSNNPPIELDLEITMDLKLYVYNPVIDDQRLKDVIMNSSIDIINAHLAKPTISATAIADEIRRTMDHLIKHVDVLGINGNVALQTLINLDESAVPNLKQELVLSDDGSVSIRRALRLSFEAIGVR